MTYIAGNSPPNITDGAAVFRVDVREENVYTFKVTDTDALTVEIEGGVPAGSFLLDDGNGLYTFTWTPEMIPTRGITFIVTDEGGASAVLSPLVQVCACFNGGQCTLEGVSATLEPIQTLTCLCTEGNGGWILNLCSKLRWLRHESLKP